MAALMTLYVLITSVWGFSSIMGQVSGAVEYMVSEPYSLLNWSMSDIQTGSLSFNDSVEIPPTSSWVEDTPENQLSTSPHFFTLIQEGWFEDSSGRGDPHVITGYLESLFSTLKTFYITTKGNNWSYEQCPSNSQWDITQMPQSIEFLDRWCGLTFTNGVLTEMNLENNNLTGLIPPELGTLKDLAHLRLNANQLNGPIPPELGDLENLTYLNLNLNQLAGSIPPEIGNLERLGQLLIRENQLTGPLPRELGKLKNLTHLDLSFNDLIDGPIPSEFANLEQLIQLRLPGNQLSGRIPPELGKLENLLLLYLFGNELTGPIPAELGNLENLENLYIDNNRFTGPIPTEILSNLENLTYLDLSENQFTSGQFPTELLNLTQLRHLNLRSLFLTGSLPSELGNLKNLTHLDLRYNELTGEIPAELGNLTNLKYLDLSINQLSGSIPPALVDLRNLDSLYIVQNNLTGEIPPEFGNFASLRRLNLAANKLTGEIPPELGNLTNLESLILGRNNLTGEIPSELGSLTNLKILFIGRNNLTGRIPPELVNLTNIEALVVRHNQLSGSFPQNFTELKNLTVFRFDTNSGLCAPPNEEFRNWLNSIETVMGDICSVASFSSEIPNQSYPVNLPIPPLILPETATGTPPIRYTLNLLDLPLGLRYDFLTYTISGTPTQVSPPVELTYQATDVNNTQDSLQFTLEVYSPVSTEQDALPQTFDLRSNYPNPFQHSTHVIFDLPWPAQIQIEVMDVIGRRMMISPPVNMEAGWNKKMEVNLALLSSGLYMYRLIVESPKNRSTHVGHFTLVR